MAGLLHRHGLKENRLSADRQVTEDDILNAANEWFLKNGTYPNVNTPGQIIDGPLKGSTWSSINAALKNGSRGLPGGSSLPDLLHRYDLKENIRNYSCDLAESDILQAIKEWFLQHGTYPTQHKPDRITNGPLRGNKWGTINAALYLGLRGLPGGSSLAQLQKKIIAENAKQPAAKPLAPHLK